MYLLRKYSVIFTKKKVTRGVEKFEVSQNAVLKYFR